MNNRFNNPSRDRSPPRYDRRPSANSHPSGGSSYRGDSFQPALDREPPAGPKAQRPDTFGPRYPFSPSARGRGVGGGGFSNRGSSAWDSRDRDRDRDNRPTQSYRARDDDRPDWPRRERDLIPSDRGAPSARDARPYGSRDRSASPPRTRRDSRDSIPPLSIRPSDSGSYYGASGRGGLGRGRGRGDLDRNRGRSSFAGERERDLFSNRSRSREGWRDRDFERPRPSGPNTERSDRFDRRDQERGRDMDSRREYDSWQRDPSPSRASAGAPLGRGTSPTAPAKMDYDIGRRPSAAITPGSLGRDRREHDQGDYFGARNDAPRRDASISSYQAQAAPTPAAGVGLDYGPPPSVPTTGAGLPEKAAQSKVTTMRNDAPPSTSPSFQPPSAPKADRVPSSNLSTQPQKPPVPQEPANKMETVTRAPRAPASSAAVAGSTEPIAKAIDSRTDLKPSMPHTPDKSLPSNVPIGPRASLGVGFRPRQPSSEPATAAALPPKAVTPDHRTMPIPTGPRSDHPTWSTAGISNRTTWVSPEYSRAKPSIMNPLGRDRPSFAPPAGPRSQSILPPHNDKPRIFPMHSSKGVTASSAPATIYGQRPSLSPAHAHARSAGVNASEDVDMSMPGSSEDEDGFDEDDFAEDEEKHRRERISLEAKKPPPLLHDVSIRNLLIRIQFLNMIMHQVIPKSSAPADTLDTKARAPEPPSIGLPSPEELSEEREAKAELKHPQPRGRPLSQPAVNPIPTPPIEDLPYRSRQSPRWLAFDESDDEVEHEAITTLIRQEFESAAFDWQDELQEMHTEYRQKFPFWRQEVAFQEQRDREAHQPSPAPASPAPSVAPSVTPSLGHERTRGARNTTEADLQAAILMSQQSLKEEEERREREAASNSQPNYDTEAVVPAMMKPSEAELNFFEDTNKLIPTNLAIEVFAYVPPEDDFTEEEQLAFMQAFCQYPKKWGKIAESLPGRSYKDCITHYYLTKSEARYKVIWRNSQPKRKRGRAATKPRSTALMSELVYDNEGDVAVAVTDTGRPRRAAAPTFGDTPGDSDIATPVPQSKRLALSREPNVETTTAKSGRGRKAGGPAKPRRTKAQMQADQQAAMLLPADGSPQKAAPAPRERSRTLLRADNGALKNDATASPELPRMVEAEMGQYSIMDPDRLPLAGSQAANNQPTSYWSVPEQQKFPQLVAYYGRDFTSIADFMKTKTVTMIKNHYNRQIQDANSDLEEIARAAERRRGAGEPMGAPPSPAAQTKRRYEATPSTASIHRPTVGLPDQGPIEADQNASSVKTGYTEDFPANAVQRSTSGVDLVAKPRPVSNNLREVQPLGSGQPKIEDLQRSQILGQKPLTGPRTGFFKDETAGFGLPRHPLYNESPHQHPLRHGESRLGDLNLPQSLLGQPRDQSGGPQGSMQPPTSQAPTMDRYGAPLQQGQHGRSGSLGMLSHHPALQDARDLNSLRRLESNPRQSPYSLAPSQPPTSLPSQHTIPSRSDTGSTAQSVPEPPKPAPAKRSNLMNLLNDDPPEPQPQPQPRTSMESKRPSLLSPQPVPVTSQSLSFEAARAQARPEEIHGLHQGIRGAFGPPPSSRLGGLSLREAQPAFQGAQNDQNSTSWMDRFDPRPQSGPSEQRGQHSSPRVGGYSVVPPSNNSHQAPRMEAQRSHESGQPDHRRMFNQMNHPGPNPSPPPQQPPQPIPPYRSLSGSSHHGRFGSTGFQQSQSQSQQSPHMHPVQQQPGPSSHPPSAGSTPVSSLHHRGQPSIDYPSQVPGRLTIQQHLAQQQQGQQVQHDPRRANEHEESLRRLREAEAQQHAMRVPERDREHLGRHRDILHFGSAPPRRDQELQPQPSTSHHHQPQHHSHNQHQHQQQQQIMAGIPGTRHLFGGLQQQQPLQPPQQQQEPVTRTYTPPGGPGLYGSSIFGHSQHPPQHQHSHSHHQHHQPQQQQQQQAPGPGAQQQQPPGQGQGQQPQGPPGPGQGQGQPPFGFGHGHGHFRVLSHGQGPGQGEGREERR